MTDCFRQQAENRTALDESLPAANAGRPRVLHVDELVERCLGNLSFAERILRKYETRFSDEWNELLQLVQAGDAEALARAAHRMKGAAASVAAHGLHSVFAEIELLSRENRLTELPRQLDRLKQEWTRFVDQAFDLLAQACNAEHD